MGCSGGGGRHGGVIDQRPEVRTGELVHASGRSFWPELAIHLPPERTKERRFRYVSGQDLDQANVTMPAVLQQSLNPWKGLNGSVMCGREPILVDLDASPEA